MSKIQILDCTLRDGGYINNWNFGYKVVKEILKKLSEAQINIVECGFLSETEYNQNRTIFNSVSQIRDVIQKNKGKYVAMIALGEKEISYDKIPKCDGTSISGIRLTFHKHEIDRAFEYAENLMKKGYEVFIQPVGTCTYSDIELLQLVERVNKLQPYAFYIVDTLGTIIGKELMRVFHMIDNNLKNNIKIGFHSHNNLQLAFANAQELIQTFTHREIIIDASVQGMGRGAGNLCTELITQFMNENLDAQYDVIPLLEIIDKYLISINMEHPWGYTIPYYISAVNKCHPNYATYLVNKQTLNIKDIEKIIAEIPNEKRPLYDKELISFLYRKYLEFHIDDRLAVRKLSQLWKDKKILVLAPGSTLESEKDKINKYIEQHHPYIIAVNFSSQYTENMIFVSNLKRFDNFDMSDIDNWDQTIVLTSNIKNEQKDKIIYVDYSSYLNSDDMIFDNAGLMLLQLLKVCGVKKLALAGFDGFFTDAKKNFISTEMMHNVEVLTMQEKSEKIGLQIKKLQADLEIEFITTSQYEKE